MQTKKISRIPILLLFACKKFSWGLKSHADVNILRHETSLNVFGILIFK